MADRIREADLDPERFIDVHDGAKVSTDHTRFGPDGVTGNYGIYASGDEPGGLVDFDVDDYEDPDDDALDALADLPATLTTETPHTDGEVGGHRFFRVVPGEEFETAQAALDALTGGEDRKTVKLSWGHARVKNSYVVGPGSQLDGCDKDFCDECAADDGGRYKIAADRPIATITADVFAEVLRADPALVDDTVDAGADDDQVPLDDVDDHGGGGGDGEYGGDGETWLTDTLIADALDALDPDMSHDDWVAIGFAVHDYDSGADGKQLFTKWSKQGAKWDAEAKRKANHIWREADPGSERAGNISVATLVKRATDAGWQPPASALTDDGQDVLDAAGWKRVRSLYADGDTPKNVARDAAFQQLTAQGHFATMSDSGEVYRYDPDVGIYRHDGEQYAAKVLGHELAEYYTTYERREITDRIKSQTYVDRETFGGSWSEPVVCVENGVLDIETNELYDHSPERRFVHRIEAPWPTPEDEGPDTPPEAVDASEAFPALVADVLGDKHDQDAFYEFIALAVHPGYIRDKALVLYGEGSNGKTTLLRAARRVIGENHTTSHSLGKLTSQEYALADLYESVANISGETLRGNVRRAETFKALTGGDKIAARNPYEGYFEFQNEAVLMFAANELPDFDEETDALYRRIQIMSCTNTFSGDQRREELIHESTTPTERMGLLVRAVTAAQRLRDRQGVIDAQDTQSARAAYTTAQDPLSAFAETALDAGGWVGGEQRSLQRVCGLL